MMGTKKLSETKAELAAFLARLPGKSPQAWLAKEIESAKHDPTRDVETLEMLLAALKPAVKKGRRPKAGRPARR